MNSGNRGSGGNGNDGSKPPPMPEPTEPEPIETEGIAWDRERSSWLVEAERLAWDCERSSPLVEAEWLAVDWLCVEDVTLFEERSSLEAADERDEPDAVERLDGDEALCDSERLDDDRFDEPLLDFSERLDEPDDEDRELLVEDRELELLDERLDALLDALLNERLDALLEELDDELLEELLDDELLELRQQGGSA